MIGAMQVCCIDSLPQIRRRALTSRSAPGSTIAGLFLQFQGDRSEVGCRTLENLPTDGSTTGEEDVVKRHGLALQPWRHTWTT